MSMGAGTMMNPIGPDGLEVIISLTNWTKESNLSIGFLRSISIIIVQVVWKDHGKPMYKCADTVPFDIVCPRYLLEGLPYTVGGNNEYGGADNGTQANDLNNNMDPNKISIHNVDSDPYIRVTKWLNDYSRLKRHIYKILNAYNRQDTRTWRWTWAEPKELEKYNATRCVLDYRSPYANKKLPANYVVKDMETPTLPPLSTKAPIMTILFEDFCDTRAAILQCHIP
jgi:hypothetical protein